MLSPKTKVELEKIDDIVIVVIVPVIVEKNSYLF